MLPARSHATSAVRVKLSPGMPVPGGPGGPGRPTPAAAARGAGACTGAAPFAATTGSTAAAADVAFRAAPLTSSSAAASAGRGAHGDRFRLPAEHQLNLAVGIELDHVARSLIDDPDV